jgi:hypothetical protein
MPRRPRTKPAKSPARKRAGAKPNAGKRPFWANYSDQRLLDLRIKDLGLRIEGTPIEGRVERIYQELADKGIRHRPHVWLSNEWFSPDGIPGIAVPFYLTHPRLVKLERTMMLEVEGAGLADCLRLLRHEVGHAISSAYRLPRKPSFTRVFGRYSAPYPSSYRPIPSSRDFVLHLDWWYAQAHPAEDFAETFAVWLKPGSKWRSTYAGWPALKKLRYMDELMTNIRGKAAPVRSRAVIEPISSERLTLRQYYEQKQRLYALETADVLERDLRRVFSSDRAFRNNPSGAAFLRAHRSDIRRTVAEWTGQFQYTIDQVLSDIIERSRQRKLRLAVSEEEARIHAMLMVAVHTLNSLRHRITI